MPAKPDPEGYGQPAAMRRADKTPPCRYCLAKPVVGKTVYFVHDPRCPRGKRVAGRRKAS